MVLVLVHGGAANIPSDQWADKLRAVVDAARIGCFRLIEGASAVDSVVAAVSSMEDDCSLNAGIGSSLTAEGTVENDAIVIDGKDLSIGAVACVSRIRNPVQLARLVLNHSDHCVLSGDGAHQFAEQHRVPLIDNRSLVHERAKARLAKCASFAQTIQSSMSNGGATNGSCAQEMMAIQANGTECTANGSAHKAIICDEHDTVGAVAVDANGNLACATSTGGLTGKAVGRIGDSPLAGSGGWAENEVCAISTTGHGELIMRVALSKHIAMLRGQCGLTLAEAVDSGLKYMSNRVGGGAGVAALDAEAQPVIQHSTPHMVWACADSERKQITYGISQHDRQITSLDVNQS